MACTGALVCTYHWDSFHKVRRTGSYSPKIHCSTSDSSYSSTVTSTIEQVKTQKFTYSRASPSVRWPHVNLEDSHLPIRPQLEILITDSEKKQEPQIADEEMGEVSVRPRRKWLRKMSKLELVRDKNWRKRVQFLTDRILGLKPEEFVADVLDDRGVQMNPSDFCILVKWVGKSSWARALEIYEWLSLRDWYSPNTQMVATVVSVLGKFNQDALAVEVFMRAEPGIEDTVQVYNAMMGVYARKGQFNKVQELMEKMRRRGCEPDLVTFNTLINARMRSQTKMSNSAIELLNEVRKSGLVPDIITYNTLISACSRESNLNEAEKVYHDMEDHDCQPDLWTYNAMISVYGRCGLSSKAEMLFRELLLKEFVPDAVTYNSVLYAFAREGNVGKVEEICEEMVRMGLDKDEMTYNTIIHMYGKLGQHDVALRIYEEMKLSGRNPDSVTYAVLIDFFGKANKMIEAKNAMSEMLSIGVKPTLQTFTALLCGYSKAGKIAEAEETFNCMLKSGIRPDNLVYSVMLDLLSKSNELKKAMNLYGEMVRDEFKPDNGLYEVLLRALSAKNREDYVAKVVGDMMLVCNISPQIIASILVRCNLYDHASMMLKLAITQGMELDRDNLYTILSSFSSSGRHAVAVNFLAFLKENAPLHHQLVTEVSITLLCNTQHLDAALEEYHNSSLYSPFRGGCTMYESLIQCCEENGLYTEASQVFCDMNFYGIEPSQDIYPCMVRMYCEMAFPETAHYLLNQAQGRGILTDNIPINVGLIEAYGKLKLWEKAESFVGSIIQRQQKVDFKVWNALLHVYAENGCYEQARAVFNTMVKNGLSPTVDSINCLLQALIVDKRQSELYVLVQDLQDLGFMISKSSIIVMLDAFIEAGDIKEVKKIYRGMKAAGWLYTHHASL